LSINTDSKKLETRIETHKQFSTYDINDWILSCVRPCNNEKLLDIGCGTGEQIISFSKNCGSLSKILAIDASAESLKIVEKKCSEKKIQNIQTIQTNMDDISKLVKNTDKFDLIISCFALYYSKNIPEIITAIKNLLSTGGRFFVCGPMEGNNAELINFHSQILKSSLELTDYPMTKTILPEIKKNFSIVEEYYFSNPLHFPEPGALINYWKSYYLYNQNIEEEFISKVKNYFDNYTEFISTKKILGLIARL